MKRNNLGISIISLVVTVIILIILLGITFVGSSTLINMSKKTSFIKDMTKIQDLISQYYISTGKLPLNESIISKSAVELLDDTQSDWYKSKLAEEISINKDNMSSFYTIDLSLINITSLSLEVSNNVDNFVMSSEGKMLYYITGQKIKDEIYFSLSNKLLKNKKIIVLDEEIEDVNIGQKVQLIKDISIWTNKIIINIKTSFQESQYLEYYIAGNETQPRLLNVDERQIIIDGDMMTIAEKDSFLASEENKKIIVQKKLGTDVISETTINIDNLDIQSPSLLNMELVDTSSTDYNLVKVNSSDNGGSSVKQTIYIYYKKLDATDTIVNYYNDEVSVLTRLAYSDKTTKDGVIKLPKNIASIIAISMDNAGNMSEPLEYNIDLQHLIAQ